MLKARPKDTGGIGEIFGCNLQSRLADRACQPPIFKAVIQSSLQSFIPRTETFQADTYTRALLKAHSYHSMHFPIGNLSVEVT